MPKDPRTQKDIVEAAECHLVPDWCGVSGRTVPLEKKLDNEIGTYCDAELERYLNSVTGTRLPGRLAMTGGSKSLSSVLDLKAKRIEVAPPNPKKKKEDKLFEDRALGAKEGEATVEAFTGTKADGHYAGVSAIHSAFLILHALNRPEVFEPMFDKYRALFDSACKKQLTEDQRKLVETTVAEIDFQRNPVLAKSKDLSRVEVKADGDPREAQLNSIRAEYDPDYDPGDGLLANFPNQCVEETADTISVKVPYSKSLRAVVRFPKNV